MFAVFSTSLNPLSRSRILALEAVEALRNGGRAVEWFDLAERPLPACDAGECYAHPHVTAATELIVSAEGILVAAPVYNYDVASSTKLLVELTGKAWTEKVVGLLCAAGGRGSYMAPLQLANSLMLDFRSLILPRFVYATVEQFHKDQISDREVKVRIAELVEQMIRIAPAVN